MYQGYGLQGVDDKGRVSIPSALRNVVEANTPRRDGKDLARIVTIAVHETEPCLVGYDETYSQKLQRDLTVRADATTEPGAPRNWNPNRLNFGVTDPLPFDASGRFVLQGYPKKYAKIGKFALFLGLGDVFEIWDPATLVANPGTPTQLKELASFLMEEKGAAL
ncbi:transcriptional regulator MraZ [soil metagenome]